MLTILLSIILAAPPPPNVLVILTDDQGWGDLSLHGNTNLQTPHLDQLARRGARFDRFFVQPVCSPTRAEFLTGRYHLRTGVHNVTTGGERLNLDESTIADAFRQARYVTGCFGKWHNGSQYPYHPLGRGFDTYYGFTSGHWATYFNAPVEHNGQDVLSNGFLADDLTSKAIQFIKESNARQKPFFCYLALNTPHSPMQVPDQYWNRFAQKPLQLPGTKEQIPHTRAALAMCENIDDNVGRLLQSLDELHLTRNTIVVYFSDNGPNGNRWNGGMKGIKGSVDEGGVRSPLFISWHGKIPEGRVIEPIAAAIDLPPTLLSLCGIQHQPRKPWDGMNLAPWLLAQETKLPERVLIQHWAGKVAARSQRYRLDHQKQLYDMVSDPEQSTDVAAQHPEVTNRLRQAVESWKQEMELDVVKKDGRPFPVGYALFPRTVLPARDGVPLGGIQRSAKAPNCSFFTHWKTSNDAMTWEIEVATPGKYEAKVHYTCSAANLGSTIQMTAGQTRWQGKISTEYDPPLSGAEQDRVKRVGESYMKPFQSLSLGIAILPAGRQTLRLDAVRVAHVEVADIRAVELVLQK